MQFRSPSMLPLTVAKSLKHNPLFSTFKITSSVVGRTDYLWRLRGVSNGDQQIRRFSSRSHLQIIADRERDELARKNGFNLTQFPPEKIRNFSIVAHIDHGKSTLADRLLELTGTIQRGVNQPQYLDKLQVERQRGITVKAQTTSMIYTHDHSSYLLNLIDTPGHVDFSYEVSRSLAACQGVLLVVDATQGIQAQTVANFYLASECNLAVIPVINKIDLTSADPDNVKRQLAATFDLDPSLALLASAKTGEGLEKILEAIIERVPPPSGKMCSPLRMLLFDSFFHEYKKVICYVAVVDGILRKGDRIKSAGSGKGYEVSDVGVMHPEFKATAFLMTGQVGYVVCGMHSTQEARVGDTLHKRQSGIQPLPGFQPAKHMVFSGLYPADGTGLSELEHAIEKLTCNDPSVSVDIESSAALGRGFRCGFLGLLHMDVFHQRLQQEYGVHVHNTIPTVPYIFEFQDGSKVGMHMCTDRYKNKKLKSIWEPTVIAKIVLPSEYLGPVITLCVEREGEQVQFSYITSKQVLLKYRLPLREIVVDFYDILKTKTSGYAIFMYEEADHRLSKLIKLDAFLNNKKVDVMATIVHKSRAQNVGDSMLQMLKKYIDRSQDNSIMITEAITGQVVSVQRAILLLGYPFLSDVGTYEKSRVPAAPLDRKGAKRQFKPQKSVSIPREAFLESMKLS
ncbi:elongation factor 4 [Striga asiatica]|uniref:Translation factor GUF1 homolog, mitochondrial n=1 Tax=Striga asiatica TaxID=4170 RepID=A0A5A7PXP6_STRAF|nr:elongation factor 4 [Striga asiatica]